MIIGLLHGGIRKFKIGDIVVLTKDVKKTSFMLTVGHELTITNIDKDGYGFIFRDEETGLIVKQISIIDYIHKISVEELKQIHKKVKDKKKYFEFIFKNCLNKDFRYEYRDRVDICKLKKDWSNCKPCNELHSTYRL